jgi:hypothetical protein
LELKYEAPPYNLVDLLPKFSNQSFFLSENSPCSAILIFEPIRDQFHTLTTMADSEPIQRVQFGEEIHPVKTTKSVRSYTTFVKDAALAEKTEEADLEQRADQIADSDLNRKKKQASYAPYTRICIALSATVFVFQI